VGIARVAIDIEYHLHLTGPVAGLVGRMRSLLVLLHRWFGLGLALFLCQAGLTGALIAWDHELDAWLNPELFRAPATSVAALTPLRLAEIVERDDPRVDVTFLPLGVEPGNTVIMSVGPRRDPVSGKPFELGFDQIAVDPATGHVQGRRLWGALSLSRQQIVPFLYKLHYSMHLPEVSGIALGIWLMGIVALVWVVDSCIALWISFPSRKAWQKSFAFRFDKGGYRLSFDLHRSGGVWAWLLLVPLAVTAVSMNLQNQVVRPLVSLLSPLAASPFADRTANPAPMSSKVPRERVLASAALDAERLGLSDPPGGVFYSPEFRVFGVGLYAPGMEHGDGGLGNPWLYYDAQSGLAAGSELPGRGSAGDLFLQLQFPLHSGRLLGVPGRALISALGLLIAMLSVTGVVIWAKKRKVRALAARKRRAPAQPSTQAGAERAPSPLGAEPSA
jgi:uncharacterized iron-regulated membrane protein